MTVRTNGEKPPGPLHRGANIDLPKNLARGQAIDFGPSSTSEDYYSASPYAENGDKTPVVFSFEGVDRALNVQDRAQSVGGYAEQEWITSGRYYVKDIRKDEDGNTNVIVAPTLGKDPVSQKNSSRPALKMDNLLAPVTSPEGHLYDEKGLELPDSTAVKPTFQLGAAQRKIWNTLTDEQRTRANELNFPGATAAKVLDIVQGKPSVKPLPSAPDGSSRYEVSVGGDVAGTVSQDGGGVVYGKVKSPSGYSATKSSWSWQHANGGGDSQLPSKQAAIDELVAYHKKYGGK